MTYDADGESSDNLANTVLFFNSPSTTDNFSSSSLNSSSSSLQSQSTRRGRLFHQNPAVYSSDGTGVASSIGSVQRSASLATLQAGFNYPLFGVTGNGGSAIGMQPVVTPEDFVLDAVRQAFEGYIVSLNMSYERNRLRTFDFRLPTTQLNTLKSWYLTQEGPETTEQMFHTLINRYKWSDNSPERLTPTELAKCGFFYLGPDDNVKCFACMGKLSCWEENDCPKDEHSRHFGVTCDFTKGRACGNIKINDNEMHPFHPALPDEERQIELRNIYPCQSPRYEHMVGVQNRLESYTRDNWTHWGKAGFPTPQRLADAGFFRQVPAETSTQVSVPVDLVTCFYCGCILHGWVEGDDPWIEHVRLYGACTFILQVRSPDFTIWVYRNFAEQRPSTTETQMGGLILNRPHNLQRTTLVQPVIDKEQRWQEIVALDEDYMPIRDALRLLPGSAKPELLDLVKLHLYEHDSEFATAGEMLQYKIEREKALEHATRMERQTSGGMFGAESDAIVRSSGSGDGNSKSKVAKLARKEDTVQLKTVDEIDEMSVEACREYVHEAEQQCACKVCLNFKATVIYEPCLHLATCLTCAGRLVQCPICRMQIKKAKRIYFT